MPRSEYVTNQRLSDEIARLEAAGLLKDRKDEPKDLYDYRRLTMPTAICWDCRLPDPYNGGGDGIGSCECSRCDQCDGRPLRCDCDIRDDLYWTQFDDDCYFAVVPPNA